MIIFINNIYLFILILCDKWHNWKYIGIFYRKSKFNLNTIRQNAFYDKLNIFNNVITSYHQMARESEHYRHENVLLIKKPPIVVKCL